MGPVQMTGDVIAIIPARGGSKGILKKNLQELAGKKLIDWTIEASLESSIVQRTAVTSDNDEILSHASQFDIEPIERPAELATDEASSESVIEHAIACLGLKSEDIIVLLQPTSPLRNASHIDQALQHYLEQNYESLISVSALDNKVLKGFYELEDGLIEPLSQPEFPFVPRQSLPKTYMSNGAIYVIRVEAFLRNNSFMSERTGYFLMGQEESADIDNAEDLKSAEKVILRRNHVC